MNTKGRTTIAISRALIILVVIVTLYPMLFVLITSFKSTQEFYINIWGLPKVWKPENYTYAWFTAGLGTYFMNSVIVSITTVAAVIITGSLAGYALAKLDVPFANTIITIMLGLTLLPSESVIMPMYIMMAKMHFLGGLHTLILPYIGWWLPVNIFIFRNFFATLPEELMESSRVDGCTETEVFTKITIPLMLPVLATVGVMSFVGIWGELLWASVSLSSTNVRTIPLGILAFQAQFATDWGPLSASIVLVLIPVVLIFVLMQKYFIEGLTAGAVKG